MRNQVRAFVVDYEQEIQIHFRQIKDDGKQYVIKIVETKEKEHGLPGNPFTELDPKDAQVLMDDLWSCGLRPTEDKGSAGTLSATEKHLDDMRKIAFKKIGIDNA